MADKVKKPSDTTHAAATASTTNTTSVATKMNLKHLGIANIGNHPADEDFMRKLMCLDHAVIKRFFNHMRLRGWLFDNGFIESMWYATLDPTHVWKIEELAEEPCQVEFATRMQQCIMQGKRWRDRPKNFRAEDPRIDYTVLMAAEEAEVSALEKKRGLKPGSLSRPKAENEAKQDQARRTANEKVLQEVLDGLKDESKEETNVAETLAGMRLSESELAKKNFDEGPEGGSDDDDEYDDDDDEGEDWENEEVREEGRTRFDPSKGFSNAGDLV